MNEPDIKDRIIKGAGELFVLAGQRRVSETDVNQLREAVALACQPQNAWRILQGRTHVAALPRDWVLSNIEIVARSVLALHDSWEYGRYLELLDHIGARDIVRSMVDEGLEHADPDVRDMAQLWVSRVDDPEVRTRSTHG